MVELALVHPGPLSRRPAWGEFAEGTQEGVHEGARGGLEHLEVVVGEGGGWGGGGVGGGAGVGGVSSIGIEVGGLRRDTLRKPKISLFFHSCRLP